MVKTTGKTTHKHQLKLKNKPPTTITDDGIFNQAVKQAKCIHSLPSISWKSFVGNCTIDELRAMKLYVKHDKSNFVCKVERLAELTASVQSIVKVRDYLNEAIAKSMDLTNDATIHELSSEELDQNTSGVCQLIDNEVKRREERDRVLAEVSNSNSVSQGQKPMKIG